MNKMIQSKLKVIQDFQSKYPSSHVGGSIGLMLRGVDLQRDLSKSDVDITVNEFELDETFEERSDNTDFDFALKKHDGNMYTKIDIRVNPEPSYDIILYANIFYNVSKLKDILFWKKKYADKGVTKHQDDLETIKTGVRRQPPAIEILDDLPF